MIDKNYMMLIEPYGLFMKQHQREEIDSHDGPGLAIRSVKITGPLTDSFPSRGHRLIFDGIDRREIEPRNPKEKLKSWYRPKFQIAGDPDIASSLQRLATRAFRRTVSLEEIAPYLDLFQVERTSGSGVEEALRTACAAILCAPDFLYLKEQPGPLDDYALAARLSYFLIRSLPDEPLLANASQGTLAIKLHEQTERLLSHPHTNRFITDFTDAWLDLREIDFTNPDEKLFPEFDRLLEVVDDRGIARLLSVISLRPICPSAISSSPTSPFSMNAWPTHYQDRRELRARTLRKVPACHLKAREVVVLSQAAVLKVTANGNNTSPVVRGVWVLERLLGIHPATATARHFWCGTRYSRAPPR